MGTVAISQGDNHEIDDLIRCKKCEQLYHFRKSKSSLKLTYCTTMCETPDLGFHLKSLEDGNYLFMPQSKVKKEPVKFSNLVKSTNKEPEQDGPESEELILV